MPSASKTAYDVAVAGSSIASLVAALELGRLGQSVIFLSGAKRPGGHFAGVDSGGYSFDAGMVFFEFTSFQPQSDDVLRYNADIRADCGRFTAVVEEYVRRFTDAREVSTPKLLLDGTLYDDFLIANELSSLAKLPSALREEIERDIAALTAEENPLHPRGKSDEARFLSATFDTASKANHGPTFHAKIIAPILKKILGPLAPGLLALHHRAAWMPLFYPETLLSELRGESAKLPPTRFHYPAAGEFRSFVENLTGEIAKETRIASVPGEYSWAPRGNEFALTAGGAHVSAAKLIWGEALDPFEEALALGGAEHKDQAASIALSFVAADSGLVRLPFSTLFVADAETPVYRVTNQNEAAGRADPLTRLVVESSAAAEGLDAGEELRKIGVLGGPPAHCETKLFKNAIGVPSRAGLADFLRRRARAEAAAPGVTFIGPSSSYTSRSFNDQIVQGLRAARLAAAGR